MLPHNIPAQEHYTQSGKESGLKHRTRPIWTPLIPSIFPSEYIKKFGQNVPLGRTGQRVKIASSYAYLASEDDSYITGQVIHPNTGEIING